MKKTNTFREHLKRANLETCDLQTFDQSDEKIWPNQQKDNDKDNYKDKDIDNPEDLWHVRPTSLTIDILNSWQSVLPDN